MVTGALIDKTGVGRISARPGGLGCPGNVEAGKEIRHQASNSPTLVSYNPRRTLFILIDALQQYWIYTGCHGKSCPSIMAAAHRFPMVIMEKGMGLDGDGCEYSLCDKVNNGVRTVMWHEGKRGGALRRSIWLLGNLLGGWLSIQSP